MRHSISTAFIRCSKGLNGLARLLVCTLIFALSLPAVAGAASDLPDGFIALSESYMTWDQAKTWCRQRGGRLPLLDGSNSRANPFVISGAIDGFGAVGARWPSGLPNGNYWTGTDCRFFFGPFVVFPIGTKINCVTADDTEHSIGRVVCVP